MFVILSYLQIVYSLSEKYVLPWLIVDANDLAFLMTSGIVSHSSLLEVRPDLLLCMCTRTSLLCLVL